jgi:TATA-binding protein-associated factor Taf7
MGYTNIKGKAPLESIRRVQYVPSESSATIATPSTSKPQKDVVDDEGKEEDEDEDKEEDDDDDDDDDENADDDDEVVLDELEKAIIEQLSPLNEDSRKLTLITIKTRFSHLLSEIKNEYGHTIDISIRHQIAKVSELGMMDYG